MTNENGLCDVVRDYFRTLLTSKCNENFEEVVDKISSCVMEEMNEMLTSQVTDREIMEAFGQMDTRKALKIDGLLELFYKEN